MKTASIIVKALAHIVLFSIALIAVCMVFGEPAPDVEYSTFQFLWDKLGAGCVLWADCKVSIKLFPKMWEGLDSPAATEE